MATIMAVAIDLTKGDVTEFSGSSEEDISYAKTFWQSVQLQPPMESRLVSSDIKQRLKVAPSGSHSISLAYAVPEESGDPVLQEFFDKAHTLQQLDQYGRIQQFVQAREEDMELLKKHREERKRKEEISRNKGVKKTREAFVHSGMESPFQDDNDYENDVKLLDDFEKSKFGDQDSDSDTTPGDQ